MAYQTVETRFVLALLPLWVEISAAQILGFLLQQL
jgi:hypothetical protein